VACLYEKRNEKEGDPLKDMGINDKMVLKCVLKNWDGRVWT
jgi:hypothetical protein